MELLYILLFTSLTAATKFNAVMVRLPLFDDFTVSYHLEVKDGGCYDWHSSRDDVAVVSSVQGSSYTEEDGCSNKAVVSATPHRMSRGVTDISATNINTGEVFLIEVEVARIAHLEFSFPSPGRRAELFLGGSRRHYRVSAKDEFGTSFTSLDGVPFEWEVKGYGSQPAQVKIVRASDTYYAVSDAIVELESEGLMGNTILLEGIEAGIAQLVVRLPHQEYSHVNRIERKIAVLQELLLRPSVVVLSPEDVLPYSIVQLHSGKFEPVALDKSRYELHIENGSVIELRPDLGLNTIVSKVIGRTRVLLREIPTEGYNLTDLLDSHITATSDVTVSPAVALSVRVIPHNVLIVGSEFTLRIGLRDAHKRELNIGPQTRVAVNLSPLDSVDVWSRSDNGTIISGVASNISIIAINAKLLTLAGKEPKTEIKGDGTLTIISALTLVPEKIVIPYITGIKSGSHRMWVRGGVPRDDSEEPVRPAEDYVDLQSSDRSVASIMTDGILVPSKLGLTRISARLKDHRHIEAHARVYVVEPLTLRIVRVVTLPSGSQDSATHALHIALWSNHPETDVPLSVTTCDSSQMQLTTLEGLDFHKIDRISDITPINQACTVILAKASTLGTALVEVSLRGMSDTVRLWVHSPLKLEWPTTDRIALTVGSSLNIIITGGPLSSSAPYDIAGHSTMKQVVDIRKYWGYPYSLPHARVYNIVCHKEGEGGVNFAAVPSSIDSNAYQVEKQPDSAYGSSNLYHSDDLGRGIIDLGIQVHCVSHVDSIQLSTSKLPAKCPERKQKVFISPDMMDMEIGLKFSRKGLLLYNVSNVDLEWSISHPIISLLDGEAVKVRLSKKYDPVPIPDMFYQVLRAKSIIMASGANSEVTLRTTQALAGFNVTVVKQLHSDKTIVRILPELNRDNLVSTIFGGSGHRHITRVLASVPWRHELSEAVSVRLMNNGAIFLRALSRTPATVRIEVEDLCIQEYAISVDVYLESVGAVYAQAPSSLAVDSRVQVSVYAVSGRDRSILPTSLTPSMSIITVSPAPRELLVRKLSVGENETIYELHGTRPGVHTLRWTCGGRASQAIRMRVFPRLRLWPRSTTLPPRSTMRISVLAKPPANIATISYSCKPEGVVEVLPSGIINVISTTISQVTITGVASSLSGDLLSQDTVSIKIVPIQGIIIQAPTYHLEIAQTLPLWISGLPNDMDRTQLCTLQQSLSFVWNILDYVPNKQDVSLTHPVTGEDLIGISTSEGCVCRFKALYPGKYTVTLSALSPGGSPWLASLELWVRPSKWAQPIILQKGIETKISSVAYSHSYQKVQYSFLDSSKALRMNDVGVVTDSKSRGSAGVVVAQAAADEFYYPIELSSVNHIMMSVKERNVQVSVGDVLKLKLSLYDGSSRLITNAKIAPIKVSSSRLDIIRLRLSDDRSLITVEILSDGAAVILVEMRDPETSALLQDHIRIHSLPQVWFPIGSVLCGSWECERVQDGAILRHLGIGLVQVVDHINVGVWIVEPKLKKRIYINSTPVSKVSILPTEQVVGDGSSLTVEIYNHNPVIVPIVLTGDRKNAGKQISNTMCNGNNLTLFEGFLVRKMIHPYTCNLEYRQEYSKYRPVIEAIPIFDFESGKFACRVRLISEIPTTKKILGKLIVKPTSNKANAEEAYATLLFTRSHQTDDQCGSSLLLLTFSNLLHIIVITVLAIVIGFFIIKGFTKSPPTVTDIGMSSPNITPDGNLSKSFNSSKQGMRSLVNSSMSPDLDLSRPIYGGPTSQSRSRFPHTFISPN